MFKQQCELYFSIKDIAVTKQVDHILFRDWSLITGRGGGHVKFYPYEKEGAEKVLAMLKGGAQKVLG